MERLSPHGDDVLLRVHLAVRLAHHLPIDGYHTAPDQRAGFLPAPDILRSQYLVQPFLWHVFTSIQI